MDGAPNIAKPKPRRRWYQYSLRTLLIVVTLAGCGFGWLGVKVREARKQTAIVAAIRKLGGSVYYDYGRDSHGNDLFNATANEPAWLNALLGDDFFRNVDGVSLPSVNGRQNPGTAWESLAGQLTRLPYLKKLDLSGTRITDAGLQRFEGLTHLESLFLNETLITDAGLNVIPRFGRLRWLTLADTATTDAGLEHLRGATQLVGLILNGTRVSDAGLEYLKASTKLKYLWLDGTQVTNAGVERLGGFTALRSLTLYGTRVTDAGAANLKQALPHCQIDY